MSTTQLEQLILSGGRRSPNFFNGRLLSAEVMWQEHAALQDEQLRLGRALGDGVAWGFETSISPGPQTTATPVVSVAPGLAVNRCGQTLWLAEATEVTLLRPSPGSSSTGLPCGFAPCMPPQSGQSKTGDGVYLLTVAPAAGTQGRAPVNGLANEMARCNVRDIIEGVQFRLLQLPLTGELNDPTRLQNCVAYLCFGFSATDLPVNPFTPPISSYGLLDRMRPDQLSDCEVPLAALHWTAAEGLRFLDQWTARRHLVPPTAATDWKPFLAPRRAAEAEAMLLQFQEQLQSALVETGLVRTRLKADERFLFLPPAGYLPTGAAGFDWATFLGPLAPASETLLDGGLLRGILRRALSLDPVRVGNFAQETQAGGPAPVPVDVYRIPGDDSFVLFARSVQGRIRVFLNPPPGATQPVAVQATSDLGNSQLNAAPIGSGSLLISRVPSGPYHVGASGPDFLPVTPAGVPVVDGRTVDVVLGLVPLPNGSLLVTVTDPSGASIGGKVSSLFAVSGSLTYNGVPTAGDKWLMGDLPPATYDITAVAPNYQTNTLTGVAVPRGQRIERSLSLLPAKKGRPSLCTMVTNLKKPVLSNVRFCMVLQKPPVPEWWWLGRNTQFTVNSTQGKNVPFTAEREIVFEASAEQSQFHTLEKVSEKDFLIQPEISQRINKFFDKPWRFFVPLELGDSGVLQWLADWKDWFADEHPGLGIDKSTPKIYMNPEYVPSREYIDLPREAQAYAVFGEFGNPLSVSVVSHITPKPVGIDKARIPGLDDETISRLRDYGIRYVDQIPGLWEGYLTDVLGRPPDFTLHLMDDAQTAVKTITETRSYYEGMTDDVKKSLTDLGLNDDVALANADRAALGEKVGSGMANRLVQQAREVVPREAWAMDDLGFGRAQVDSLAAQDISSKGELVAHTKQDTDAAGLAKTLGLDKNLVLDISNNALTQMTAHSFELAGRKELTEVPGVNASGAGKLRDANITNVEALAGANASDLAVKAGISETLAADWISGATAVSRNQLPVSALAPVSKEGAATLGGLEIKNVGELTGKDSETIKAAFGGDAQRAKAVLDGIKLGKAGFGAMR